MEENTLSLDSNESTLLSRKAWTAYVSTTFIGILAMLMGAVILPFSVAFGAFFIALIFAWMAYRFFYLQSVRLYCDDSGVWVFSGILPWNKGTRGVKWRDLDEAVFYTSLSSWLFRSYTLRIGHRYTKASEIVLNQMAWGVDAVTTINQTHRELVRTNSLN